MESITIQLSLTDIVVSIKEQAQESLAAPMSLSDISDIVTSWTDCYKNSTPNFNFSL